MKPLVNHLQKVKLEKGRRILITSDIHGGYQLFKKLLERLKFNANDYLFIVGDMIERGNESLKTLRYIMELSKVGNVYITLGNNETIIWDLLSPNIPAYLPEYLENGHSIIHEMCEELDTDYSKIKDLKEIQQSIANHFHNEIEFITNLPTIIETDRLLFAHAGINDYANIETLDIYDVLKQNIYMSSAPIMPKLLFVGHYPVLVYSGRKLSLAPVRDFKKRIISIDGGYSVKEFGQINCVVITSEDLIDISFESIDDLKEVEVIHPQEESAYYYSLPWGRDKISVVKEEDDNYLCAVEGFDRLLVIPKKYLFYIKSLDSYYCADYTNYFPKLLVGEVIKKVEEDGDLVLIKVGNIIGWTRKENIV